MKGYGSRRIPLSNFRVAVKAMKKAEHRLLFLFDEFLKERYMKLYKEWENRKEQLAEKHDIHNALEYVETTRAGLHDRLWEDFGNWLWVREMGFNQEPTEKKAINEHSRDHA